MSVSASTTIFISDSENTSDQQPLERVWNLVRRRSALSEAQSRENRTRTRHQLVVLGAISLVLLLDLASFIAWPLSQSSADDSTAATTFSTTPAIVLGLLSFLAVLMLCACHVGSWVRHAKRSRELARAQTEFENSSLQLNRELTENHIATLKSVEANQLETLQMVQKLLPILHALRQRELEQHKKEG
jgi:HAMP domain-containing protein